MVNFASLRSAYDVTLEAIKIDQLRTIAIIAEGIPENMTRTLNKKAKDKGVIIIGPATVGKETQIKPRLFLVIAMYCQGSSSQIKSRGPILHVTSSEKLLRLCLASFEYSLIGQSAGHVTRFL